MTINDHLLPSMTQPLPDDSNLIRLPDVVSSFTGVESESICVIARAAATAVILLREKRILTLKQV